MRAKYALLSFLILFSFFVLSYSQLGEQAGQPTLNVNLGGSSTFNYTIFNSGSTQLNFTVILPTLNTIPHNATPTVTVTPMNGTLAAGSQQLISIKVSMPYSDKVGLKWMGIVQVVEAAPAASTSGGFGATITAGVAKILTIYSIAPKAMPLIYYVIPIVVVAAALVAVYFVMASRKTKAAARKKKKVMRTIKKVKKGAKSKGRRRKTTRGRQTRKSARRRRR